MASTAEGQSKLEALPGEILDLILRFSCCVTDDWGRDLWLVAQLCPIRRTCRRLFDTSTPILYESVSFVFKRELRKFMAAVHAHPERARLVQRAHYLGGSITYDMGQKPGRCVPSIPLFTNLQTLSLVGGLGHGQLRTLPMRFDALPQLTTFSFAIPYVQGIARRHIPVRKLLPIWGSPRLESFSLEGCILTNDPKEKKSTLLSLDQPRVGGHLQLWDCDVQYGVDLALSRVRAPREITVRWVEWGTGSKSLTNLYNAAEAVAHPNDADTQPPLIYKEEPASRLTPTNNWVYTYGYTKR